jgi:hypothetical protein
LYPLKHIPLTALDTGSDNEDDPAVIPQQTGGDREGADEDDESDAVAGPKVLAHTNLAKTGGK